jgi:transcription elongation GreA/GreB family factor
MMAKELKKVLLGRCSLEVENRFQKIKKVLDDIKVSLLEESKSSAGDKHETGRAMLQIERENAGHQLREIENLQSLIRKIDIVTVSDYARLGSLVYTNHGIYFISISIGEIKVEDENYYCIALHSPIGNFLAGKKKEDTFMFNETEFKILTIK